MKIVASLIVLASATHGFTPALPHYNRRASFVVSRMVETETTPSTSTASDFPSAMPESDDDSKSSAFTRLGVPKENFAMGVDVNEVLQWLGTREDLVEKFMRDNKSFKRERAEKEVDNFLMDAEMMTLFIAYEKRKAEEGTMSLRDEAEANFKDPQVWGIYAAWIIGGISFSLIKNYYVEPKYASGEWKEIHLDIGSFFGKSAADIVATTISDTAETVATISDSAASAVQV